MFKTLAGKITKDKDLPERTWNLQVLRSVLDGSLYDNLKYSFQDERNSSGEYIPLRDRRPSVRYNLCRMVVQDSVALLFGDGHFPTIGFNSPDDMQTIADILKETKLAQTMHEAAILGSIGSVAVMMRVLNGRIFFDAMDTDYLTPKYNPNAPDTLLSVTERYKVKGRALVASGYNIAADHLDRDFWFQRVWDGVAENWYLPVLVETEVQNNAFKNAIAKAAPAEPTIDNERTVKHGLGFVPIVWIKNLPTGKGIDGACTFRPAIDTQIEIEYQLSQAGRGLKYSSDPLLMIKEPAGEGGPMVRTPATALVVSENGDAKMLEISGTAATAVIEYVRVLRESAIETIHGNRSNADKVSAAQSGRALEMMHQPLIWLADQLRTNYGENGVLPRVRMIIAACVKFPTIKVLGKQVKPFSSNDTPALRWPKWFASTGADIQQEATALKTLRDAGVISRETAVKSIASTFDIEDIEIEIAAIAADEEAEFARALEMKAQVKATATLPD